MSAFYLDPLMCMYIHTHTHICVHIRMPSTIMTLYVEYIRGDRDVTRGDVSDEGGAHDGKAGSRASSGGSCGGGW